MFEIDSRTDHFIESDPEHENWWHSPSLSRLSMDEDVEEGQA